MSTRSLLSSVALALTLSAPMAMAESNGGISAGVAADLLNQLENLQYEVSQLRGKVEQQQHELDKMQALQKDRYIDLDKRVSLALSQASAARDVSQIPVAVNATTPNSAPSVSSSTVQVSPVKLEEPSAQATAAYTQAYDLIKARNFEQARTAFERFVVDYPNNTLTGNAHYWLGELALVLGSQGEALVQFKTVIDSFSGHAKVPDAIYKLGVVNDQLGNQALAKEYLQRVISQYVNSKSAKLATNYLNNM